MCLIPWYFFIRKKSYANFLKKNLCDLDSLKWKVTSVEEMWTSTKGFMYEFIIDFFLNMFWHLFYFYQAYQFFGTHPPLCCRMRLSLNKSLNLSSKPIISFLFWLMWYCCFMDLKVPIKCNAFALLFSNHFNVVIKREAHLWVWLHHSQKFIFFQGS